MRTSAILCAALAGSLGFGGLASAQTFDLERARAEQRQQRQERREDRQERRAERRDDRQQDRREARREERRDRAWAQQHYPRYYAQPSYNYRYSNGYYRTGPRFYRGGYLPHEYRQRAYYVSNWNAYPGLYAPPYGHQWVNVDGEFLLIALATGLIANAILN